MAQTITHKHSNNPNERPNNRQLALGEIGINTSDQSPGLYTPLTDGSMAKIGPVHVGPNAPILPQQAADGEEWFDSANEELKLWENDTEQWIPSSYRSPNTVLVDSLNPRSSDELLNNGQNRPFQTLNRACLEVAKQIQFKQNPDDLNYTILLQSSHITAINDPGLYLNDFRNTNEVLNQNSNLSYSLLTQLNSAAGGIVIPPNTTIKAANPYKVTIRPSFVPEWAVTTYQDIVKPPTAILRWTDGCSVAGVNFSDKHESIRISEISQSNSGSIILKSSVPHTFSTEKTDQVELYQIQPLDNTRIPLNTYQVQPIDSFHFSLTGLNGKLILHNEFLSQFNLNLDQNYLLAERNNKTHHRVSIIQDSSDQEIELLNNKIDYLYNQIESVRSISTFAVGNRNNNFNRINYITNLTLNTQWGLNGIKSSKQVQINGYLYSAQQKDPQVYEIYANREWSNLVQIYNNFLESPQESLNSAENAATSREGRPRNPIEFLQTISEENKRFYYRHSDNSDGTVDPKSDTRFYGYQVSDSGYVEAYQVIEDNRSVSSGFLSHQGGQINFNHSKINSIRSLGYSTTSRNKTSGFEIFGIRRPLNIPKSETERACSFEKIYINLPINSISTVAADDLRATGMILGGILKPESDLLPYILAPGDTIYADWLDSGISFSADIPINNDNWLVLNENSTTELVLENPNITFESDFDVADFGLPYLRRFIDNRPLRDRHYYFHIKTTQENRQPPQVGDILQITPSLNIQPGSQLNPSKAGGWNHMFYVADVLNRSDIEKDNLQYKKLSNYQEYYISVGLIDDAKPWATSVSETNPLKRAAGTYVTRYNVVYQNIEHDLTGNSLEDTVWQRSNRGIVLQNQRSEFPENSNYADSDPVFARGLTTSLANYRVRNLTNLDPQNVSVPNSDSNFVLADVTDPDWTHNRQATKRLLNLLGFQDSTLENGALQPERPERRVVSWVDDGSTGVFGGNLTSDGFLTSKAAVPVVFHRPSKITLDGPYSGHSEELWGGRGPSPLEPSLPYNGPNSPPPHLTSNLPNNNTNILVK